MAVSSSVFIYNGRGADSNCVKQTRELLEKICGAKCSIVEVDASYMAREAACLSLYVFPGGKAMEMGFGLNPAAKKISEYVRSGAGVVALCASAMAASSDWSYFLPIETAPYSAGIHNTEEFFLLNLGVAAFAPTFTDGKCKSEDDLKHPIDRLADIQIHLKEDSKRCKCFWSQGPAFPQFGKEDRVVAEYMRGSSINPLIKEGLLPAVVHSKYGSGNIVSLGIHPELARWAQSRHSLSDEDVKLNDELFAECCTMAGLSLID